MQLAREGAHIVAFDLRRQPREGGPEVLTLTAEAREAEGLRPSTEHPDVFVEGSVADSAAVEAALGAAVGGFGRLDVLVNCAAKMDGHALLETSEDECVRHTRLLLHLDLSLASLCPLAA